MMHYSFLTNHKVWDKDCYDYDKNSHVDFLAACYDISLKVVCLLTEQLLANIVNFKALFVLFRNIIVTKNISLLEIDESKSFPFH